MSDYKKMVFKRKFNGKQVFFTIIPGNNETYILKIDGAFLPRERNTINKAAGVVNQVIQQYDETEVTRMIQGLSHIVGKDKRLLMFIADFIRKSWPFRSK